MFLARITPSARSLSLKIWTNDTLNSVNTSLLTGCSSFPTDGSSPLIEGSSPPTGGISLPTHGAEEIVVEKIFPILALFSYAQLICTIASKLLASGFYFSLKPVSQTIDGNLAPSNYTYASSSFSEDPVQSPVGSPRAVQY
ncbi:hypothetical protein B9Z19DRAFT_1069781 [Tuber borchii]|uniref:Uncharacterized protein n=1 Tax=Tuber borchii TaxID=42251 RepID=A0A2T6ZA92_TUBBO|nr:hypothetical protein B9Z19DRAFT_1069781 [Tuber borchii]